MKQSMKYCGIHFEYTKFRLIPMILLSLVTRPGCIMALFLHCRRGMASQMLRGRVPQISTAKEKVTEVVFF